MVEAGVVDDDFLEHARRNADVVDSDFLFLSGIQQAFDGNVLGGLQYALVAPLAADAGLLTLAGGFELLLLLQLL